MNYGFLGIDMPLYDEQVEALTAQFKTDAPASLQAKVANIGHDSYGSFKFELVEGVTRAEFDREVMEWAMDNDWVNGLWCLASDSEDDDSDERAAALASYGYTE